ncbi:heavy-metal-associated domain-containing protein [Trinickia diaoshuihuensis]|uniref:heavy-metal-associated domain-containing protein n=1 Tax=Trinickia diaoshuihuensis TaxID=2292265 RepID=UPI000E281F04|nr:heavy-metal-associated domain-containing protein [Trinickia diaoshuihuensis]
MIEFQVEGMSCQHCVGAVTKAIRAIDTAALVEVNLDDQRVRVQSRENAERLGNAIVEAGYEVKGSRTIVDA